MLFLSLVPFTSHDCVLYFLKKKLRNDAPDGSCGGTLKVKGDISEEGQELLEDKDNWGSETALRGVIHESRKRERSNDDGVFMQHQKGPITSTFTADWFLREGRELLGEWMKLTSVRSQDQRRMLQANSHTFPTNAWIHKITKKKESDRCDLFKAL